MTKWVIVVTLIMTGTNERQEFLDDNIKFSTLDECKEYLPIVLHNFMFQHQVMNAMALVTCVEEGQKV